MSNKLCNEEEHVTASTSQTFSLCPGQAYICGPEEDTTLATLGTIRVPFWKPLGA